MRKVRFFAAALGVVSATIAFNAMAEDKGRAETLYNHAMDACEEGDYKRALLSFADSYQFYPSPGTLFQWADCEDAAGNVTAASIRYVLYLDNVKQLPPDKRRAHADRAKQADARLAAWRKENATLSIVLPPNAPEGVIVKRDGVILTPTLLGVAIPVSSGSHSITIRRPDGVKKENKLTIVDKTPIEYVVEIPPPPPRPIPPPPPPVPPAPPATPKWQMAALGTGVLGLGGVVMGAVSGRMAMTRADAVKVMCPQDVCITDAAYANAYKAQTLALVSTIGFGVGIAGLATGTVLFLVGRRKDKTTAFESIAPHVGVLDAGPTGVVIGIRGGF